MKIPGDIQGVANEIFSAEQLDNLELKSNINSYELLLFLPKEDGKPQDAVGIQIPLSMFHQTEDYHSNWRNVMRNLLERYNLKIQENN